MLFFASNDVETTSLQNHCLSDETGYKVWKEGMPALLDIYAAYNLKSTFFFTGTIAKLYPDIVKMVKKAGHEVGCHGLVHDADKAFDVLCRSEQVKHLIQAKGILEDISSEEVISFRAPALRVNTHTPGALMEAEFKIDSSVSPQRLDFIFSFGTRYKLSWVFAPRKPYITSEKSLARKGNSGIFEIPLNAIILPYNGTIMRISPILTRIVRAGLLIETKLQKTPQSFLIHPNELIVEKSLGDKIPGRSKNYLSYLIADKLRHIVKLKNLGPPASILFKEQIEYLVKNGFYFSTMKDYYNQTKNL